MVDDSPDIGSEGRLQLEPLLHDHPAALRISLLLWALSAVPFVALAVSRSASLVQQLDDVVFDAAVSAEWAPLVAGARVLDFVGSIWVTLPIMIGVTALLATRRRWEAFFSWTVAMVLSQLFIGPVKNLYERIRPPDSLVDTTSWSFPSGHAVAGATIAISLVIVLVPPGTRRRNLEMLAAAYAVIQASSRVYLRAHWFSDGFAGAALGAAIALGAAALVHRFDERQDRRAEMAGDQSIE